MKILKNIKTDYLLASAIVLLIVAGTSINIYKQAEVDRTKLPEKLETNKNFQRWITNIKNNKVNLEADEFRYVEDTEIYNTKWTKVSLTDDPKVMDEFNKNIEVSKTLGKKIIYAPSERAYLDIRNEPRGSFSATEAHFYGIRDDRLIDARILKCYSEQNCMFDRAYFLSNDVFVISEVSLVKKLDYICATDQICEYTFKIHLIDLINNLRITFESEVKELNLDKIRKEL